jgi:hypothetical protein
VRVERGNSDRWIRGQSYDVKTFAFHDTEVPAGAVVATLVLTEAARGMRPEVVGDRRDISEIAFPRYSVDIITTWHMIGSIVEGLRGS